MNLSANVVGLLKIAFQVLIISVSSCKFCLHMCTSYFSCTTFGAVLVAFSFYIWHLMEIMSLIDSRLVDLCCFLLILSAWFMLSFFSADWHSFYEIVFTLQAWRRASELLAFKVSLLEAEVLSLKFLLTTKVSKYWLIVQSYQPRA